MSIGRWLSAVLLTWAIALPASAAAPVLQPQTVRLGPDDAFTLQVPVGYRVRPVVQGLKRVRFFARSPDGRLFLTDMHDRTDNTRGRVLVLDGWDAERGTFARVTPVMDGLRNPNSIAFHTDASGMHWLYVALTHALVRHRYMPGALRIDTPAQTLATFPDHGLDYKYGGWHLTRTVVVDPDGTAYVSVGSSCNACIETEPVRASIVAIAPDGTQRTVARGLRNAVGLVRDGDGLLATNQGADHLGLQAPDEGLYRVVDGMDAGWPHCYKRAGRLQRDPKFPRKRGCSQVAKPMAWFPAHASALGLAAFEPGREPGDVLAGHVVVALHGSTNVRLGHGYKLVRVARDGRTVDDLVTGFLDGVRVHGRPAGVIDDGAGGLFFSDDRRGVIYQLQRVR